ncbi:MAG: PAS domain S-box protein [Deltaproteobacteria bacterium]|nr:PAS domain S-box protein [Deltaproteobacteria bacterium]
MAGRRQGSKGLESERRAAYDAAERLAAIVTDSDDAIISVTLDGIVTSWNLAAERIYGYTAAEAIGHHIDFTAPPDRLEEPRRILAAIARGERVSHFETVRRRKNGTLFDVSLMISPIRDSDGRVVGVSGIARDITEHKRLQQMRDEFVLIISHEMRNPLTAIEGALSNLKVGVHGTASPAQAAEIALALRNVKRIERFLETLRDAQRLAALPMPCTRCRIDPRTLVHDTVTGFQQMAVAGRIALTEDLPAAMPPVNVDPDRITEVLHNLVRNALRFAARRIVVAMSVLDGVVQLSVSDDGPGIAQHELESLFHRVPQVPHPDESGEWRSGLGLTICRRIVEQHGGRIWVDSGAGYGARFHFTLPRTS